MIIYLVNKDSEHAKSLMLKLDGPHKDGEFIQCTQGEMDSINKKDIVQISSPVESIPCQFVEIEDGKNYCAVVDERVNIEDLISSPIFKAGHLSIIRVCLD